MTYKIRLFPLSAAIFLSACASTAPAPESITPLPDNVSAEKAPASIPYPQLTQQTQIDRLGIQVARLEREIGLLQNRIQQLENQPKARTAVKRPATPVQRLDDNKLKSGYLASGSAAVHRTDEVAANETRLFNQAWKYYQRNNFTAAVAVLRGSDGGNGSETARRNMYLLLQSQQRLGNCESVIETGGRYVSRFRSSIQAADALFSIGQCQYRMQQKDIARSTWRKLIHTYPESDAAKRAAVRLKER